MHIEHFNLTVSKYFKNIEANVREVGCEITRNNDLYFQLDGFITCYILCDRGAYLSFIDFSIDYNDDDEIVITLESDTFKSELTVDHNSELIIKLVDKSEVKANEFDTK